MVDGGVDMELAGVYDSRAALFRWADDFRHVTVAPSEEHELILYPLPKLGRRRSRVLFVGPVEVNADVHVVLLARMHRPYQGAVLVRSLQPGGNGVAVPGRQALLQVVRQGVPLLLEELPLFGGRGNPLYERLVPVACE